MNTEFLIADVTTGKLNAMVKNIMGRMKIDDPNEAVRRVNSGEWVVSEAPKPKLLEFIDTTVVPASAERFVAGEKFAVNTADNAEVKIGYLSGNFSLWFLGKTEEPVDGQTLNYAKLRKQSVDGPILSELGGEEKAETTLAEMFSLMKKQGKGEAGVLLMNGYANIYYIRDESGVLRAVIVYWYCDGWRVYALSVEHPDVWDAGDQVFSRKPSES
jgi:hypothetical protein